MKILFKYAMLIFLVKVVVLSSQTVYAQNSPVHEQLKVVFLTGEYRPYSSENMPDLGATVELVKSICKAADIEPEIKFFPWKRTESSLLSGFAFGAFPYSINPERETQFDFSENLYNVTNVLAYNNENPKLKGLLGNEDLSDLKKYTFGIIMGSFAEQRLKKLKINYQTVATVDQLVTMLKINRIDFYIDDEAAIFDSIHRLYPNDVNHFKTLNKPFDMQKANNVMVSRNYPNSKVILKKFNAGLAAIKNTREYDQILAKYHLRK